MTHLDRRTSEHGASLLEYTLLLALVALVALGGLGFTGRATAGAFEQAATTLEAAGAAIGQPATPVDRSPAPEPARPSTAPESPDGSAFVDSAGAGAGHSMVM